MAGMFGWTAEVQQKRKWALQKAVALQFNDYYGTDVDDINAWQVMCAMLGVKRIPDDLKSCRAVC